VSIGTDWHILESRHLECLEEVMVVAAGDWLAVENTGDIFVLEQLSKRLVVGL
jgi:hypothetical protein